MISCTEFIPAYSELFSWLEDHYGREEVSRFWNYLFEPDSKGVPLINFVEREGIRGCFSYWAGSLNEEAADFTMYVNEKRGFFLLEMHQCPSKGRLLKLKEEIGITPYRDYCLHCDCYRLAIEKVGLEYIYNFAGADRAACSILIYDPKIFDGRVIIDEDTEIMDRKASENEYFHRDFHSGMNLGMQYLGEKYGVEAIRSYLTRYTNNVLHGTMQDMKDRGLKALQEKIIDTYVKEKAEDALTTQLSEDEMSLQVEVKYCPAVRHLKATGRTISEWYRYSTEIVMETLANFAGFAFQMDSYDDETGAAAYHFYKAQ